jgi:hypothetical protein
MPSPIFTIHQRNQFDNHVLREQHRKEARRRQLEENTDKLTTTAKTKHP